MSIYKLIIHVFSAKDGREELCISDLKDAAEKAAEKSKNL